MQPLTDAEADAQRLLNQDRNWQQLVLRTYPDAVRPEVAFAGYVPQDDWFDVIAACYTQAGVPFDLGHDKDGVVGGIAPRLNSEADAVRVFTCQEEHPVRPLPKPDAHFLGWIYDYLTQFLVPCYTANGIQNPPPPTREDFIANFPHQNWWPSQGSMPMGTAEDDALITACPPLPN